MHKLTVEKNIYGAGVTGYCECSDPDWTGDGWAGQVEFYGNTASEVRNYYADHLVEVKR